MYLCNPAKINALFERLWTGSWSLALLHLVEVVGASVVYVMAEPCSHHGHSLQVSVVTLQVTCLRKFRDNVCLRNATCLNNSNEIYQM